MTWYTVVFTGEVSTGASQQPCCWPPQVVVLSILKLSFITFEYWRVFYHILLVRSPRFFIIIFYRSMVDLQCCVSFRCTAKWISYQFSSVTQLYLTLCDPMSGRPPCPTPAPGVHPNPCPWSRWCHPTISSAVIPFSSCPQSLPASGSFQMSQLFAWGGQSIGVSASTSAPPMNTQDWSPLGWTGWISLQPKGPSRIFSSTKVQKHPFFSTQLSL